MHSGTACSIGLAGLIVLFVACDKKLVDVPSGDDGLFASAATGHLSASSALSAVAVSAARIDLAWQDNANNETGFEIHRSTAGDSGPFGLLTVTSANVTRYTNDGLAAGSTYCYVVRAFRKTGRKTSYDAFSSPACATTHAPPPSPSNVTAKPSSSTAVEMAWSDNSGTEDGFHVERSVSDQGPWAHIATSAANATSANDAGLENDQRVCYRVTAFNAWGASAPSAAACTAPPAAPSNLATSPAPQGIDLTWSDNSVVEQGYEVLRSMDGLTFTPWAQLPADATTFRDTQATTNEMFWYQVRAWKDGGPSDLSNTASAAGSCVATRPTEDVCDNELDDDCDGLIDPYDPDCGVPRCDFDFCPPGMVCGYDGFCVSHCDDGQHNGDEGDVDCGGSCSTKCQAGQHCWVHADCASGVCISDICQPVGGTP